MAGPEDKAPVDRASSDKGMRVRDVMSRQVYTVSPTDTAQSVARLMKETGVGALPVEVPGVGTILGIVTDRDILVSVVAQALSTSTAVFEFMTVAAESCEEGDSILLAAQKMHDLRIRQLVVVDEKRHAAGIIALADIVRVSPELGELVLEGMSRHREPEDQQLEGMSPCPA
ncbi:inosine-5-monophosphate dehydrogenase [Sinorhizobium fredii USDA 205]|uniref:CBS domain-containing protein n=2 Tax=Rhizobium fredii TaxID=380 RepID=A0A844A3V0_RHIFR|nr:CBS domain-containing protein [Sinorhizobium fredii]KSV85942.1 inosine-5-monophosphate dehydrogenase [Sinorhizobium fredii USDA 205]MQX07799.1 CBS domain-containing protein [Sinorhizobium fredii]CCE99809.1 inosine-5'-monophosphate dehydrogenase [Sinorhizobium fredii HH103]GEC33341.1 inosine-5-monophosphate dehydrogenase [Sinorhizobium fredii]GLS07643.1 inosine-5-monophosphate dehydrogenase [Sinorhizobium fredii]